jgi:hypothetical protein
MVPRPTPLFVASLQRSVRRPDLIGLVLLVAAVAIGVPLTIRIYEASGAINGYAVDWRTYAAAVERWQHGVSIFDPRQLAGPYSLPSVVLTGYAYPPASVLLFIPFVVGGGYPLWLAFMVGLLVTGLIALVRSFGLGLRTIGAIGLVAAIFAPLQFGLAVGNVNIATAGLLAWTWALGARREWPLAAAVAGVAKVFPAAVAVWTARSRGWRAVALTALIGLSLIVITLPLFGVGAYRDFVVALANAQPSCESEVNVSVACLSAGFIGIRGGVLLGDALAIILVVAAWKVPNPSLAFACLGFAILAPATDLHLHYWTIAAVALLPALMTVVASRSNRSQYEGTSRSALAATTQVERLSTE